MPLRGSVQAGSQRKKLSSENVDGQLTYYDDAVVPQPPFKFSFNRISLSSAVCLSFLKVFSSTVNVLLAPCGSPGMWAMPRLR